MAEAVRSKLLAPVKPLTQPYNHCGNRTNLKHENVCKGALRIYIARHDQINKSFVNLLKDWPKLNVKIERDLNNKNNKNSPNFNPNITTRQLGRHQEGQAELHPS